jgi:hypothetical protein
MRYAVLAMALAACGPIPKVRIPEPQGGYTPAYAPDDRPQEAYDVELPCPGGPMSVSVELFRDGEARIDVRGPGTDLRVDATAVPIPDGAAVLTFDGSSEQLGFADGEAVLVLSRNPDGSAVLGWERWAPSCPS